MTESDDFPTVNAQQGTLAGSSDAFLVILTADAQLTYSSYLGGSDLEEGRDVAIDGSGNVFVAGITTSTDFPVTAGAFQPTFSGGNPGSPFSGDFFAAKYNAARSVEFATYLGGSRDDRICGIAANASGQLTIAGASASVDFPVANAFQGTFGGGGFEGDMTVSRLNSDGDGLIYSTYIGGAGSDQCSGIALGPNDEVFVSGTTTSLDFPVIGGESSPEAGSSDGVLVMIDTAGQPVYSVRSNRPGDDKFVEVTVDDSNTAMPVSVFADTIAILEKTQSGLLELVFEFEAPRIRIWAAQAASGFLVLAGDNAGAGVNTPKTFKSTSDATAIGVSTGPRIQVEKRLRFPGRAYELGQTVEWDVTVTNVGAGLGDAHDVRYKDVPGPGLRFVGDNAEFQIGTLAQGDVWTGTVLTEVTAALGDPDEEEFLNNHISVSSSNAGEDDKEASVEASPNLADFIASALLFGANFDIASSRTFSIDVFVDSVRIAENLEENTISVRSQVELRYASPRVEIVPAGSPDNSNPIASVSLDLVVRTSEAESRLSNLTQYILNQVSDDSMSVLVKLDAHLEAGEPGSVEFFIANSTAVPLDVVLLANGTGNVADELIVDDLKPGSTSDYVAVDPGLHQIELRSADGSQRLVTFEFDWLDSAGDAVVVLTAGDSDSINARAMTGDGTISDPKVVSSAESGSELPTAFRILLNYPNPFNPSTTIQYELAGRANATLAIYDVAGHRIRTLVSQDVPAGRYDVVWDGRSDGGTPVASGAYIVRLET
ncbi:MAG: SBBP repeat-containing protein, partial [Rhodothermia bacterium]